jgi:hypothetical protein
VTASGMLFPLLLAGHLLGDWVVQTDWQAATKGWVQGDYQSGRHYWTSIRANQAHCLTYHLAMAALVVPVWHAWGTLVAFAANWATHGFIDRRWPVRWLLRNTGSPACAEQLWGVIAADQALHLVILVLIAAAAS